MQGLETEVAGIKLSNPLILASGVVGNSIQSIVSFIQSGASCAVTKSVGVSPRSGYPEPTFYNEDNFAINAVGLSNPGVKEFCNILAKAPKLPLIVSIFGSSPEEFVECIKTVEKIDVLGYELNLSCPHVPGYGTEIGHDPQLVFEVVRSARKSTKKPIFVKLSPNTEKIIDVARKAEEAGADSLVAINTVRATMIDISKGKPVVSNKIGGLSGDAIRPIALRCVYELYEQVSLPIVGVGGISSWENVVQFFMAGAKAVQIGTAAIRNKSVFQSILDGLCNYMERNSITDLSEIVGIAHS